MHNRLVFIHWGTIIQNGPYHGGKRGRDYRISPNNFNIPKSSQFPGHNSHLTPYKIHTYCTASIPYFGKVIFIDKEKLAHRSTMANINKKLKKPKLVTHSIPCFASVVHVFIHLENLHDWTNTKQTLSDKPKLIWNQAIVTKSFHCRDKIIHCRDRQRF